MPILPLARSLESNRIGDEGASALAAILKETMISNLKCAAAPECSLSCQRPLTCLHSHRSHPAPRSHSFYNNGIGAKGASALAAILKETQITDLKCAAPPAFAFMSMPISHAYTLSHLSHPAPRSQSRIQRHWS